MCYGYIMYTHNQDRWHSAFHRSTNVTHNLKSVKLLTAVNQEYVPNCNLSYPAIFFATESLCINTFFALCVSYQFTLKHENPIILSPLNHSHSDIITVVQSYDYWMRWEEIRWDETIKIKLYHHTMTMHVALMECTTINLGSNIRFLPCAVKDKGVWYQLVFLNIGLELTF